MRATNLHGGSVNCIFVRAPTRRVLTPPSRKKVRCRFRRNSFLSCDANNTFLRRPARRGVVCEKCVFLCVRGNGVFAKRTKTTCFCVRVCENTRFCVCACGENRAGNFFRVKYFSHACINFFFLKKFFRAKENLFS